MREDDSLPPSHPPSPAGISFRGQVNALGPQSKVGGASGGHLNTTQHIMITNNYFTVLLISLPDEYKQKTLCQALLCISSFSLFSYILKEQLILAFSIFLIPAHFYKHCNQAFASNSNSQIQGQTLRNALRISYFLAKNSPSVHAACCNAL